MNPTELPTTALTDDARVRQTIDILEARLTLSPDDFRASLPTNTYRLLESNPACVAVLIREVFDDGPLPAWLDDNLILDQQAKRRCDFTLVEAFAASQKDPQQYSEDAAAYIRLAYISELIDPLAYAVRYSKYFPARLDEFFAKLREVAAKYELTPETAA